MKKHILPVLVLSLALVLTLLLSACGGNTPDTPDESAAGSESAAPATESPADPSPVTDPETERTTDPETDGTTDQPEDKGGCFGVLGAEGMLLVLMMVLAVIGFKKEKNSQIP